MKHFNRLSATVICILSFIVCLIWPVVTLADEDPATYRVAVKLGYQTSGKIYGKFYSPIYFLDPALDNLLISVETKHSEKAVIRSYIRFRDQKNKRWSRFYQFEGEYHFASVEPISAYQLLFIIVDFSKGNNSIERFTAQGRLLGEANMSELLKPPSEFIPARPWPKPKIVSREEWKARPPKADYTYHTPQKIIIHHTWRPVASQYTGAATIRGIQNYHMDDPSTGWIDIGYHFLIGPDGIIYQGRPENAIGAHCPPNTNMVGVCVIGDYDPNNDIVTPAMEKSLVDLLSWLSASYKIDPRTQYYGHRDFSPKTCPGDQVYDRLPQYREKVLENIGEIKPN